MGEHKFEYNGPIMFYNNVVCPNWSGTTFAVSKQKAMNNLRYQANKFLGKTQQSKITLTPDKVMEV